MKETKCVCLPVIKTKRVKERKREGGREKERGEREKAKKEGK